MPSTTVKMVGARHSITMNLWLLSRATCQSNDSDSRGDELGPEASALSELAGKTCVFRGIGDGIDRVKVVLHDLEREKERTGRKERDFWHLGERRKKRGMEEGQRASTEGDAGENG